MKYNEKTSKEIRSMRPEAIISEGYLAIYIYDVRHEYNNEYVVWGWSDEIIVRRSKLRNGHFRAGNHQWYSLDDAIKTIF